MSRQQPGSAALRAEQEAPLRIKTLPDCLVLAKPARMLQLTTGGCVARRLPTFHIQPRKTS